jgi:putative acetyltransferase
MLPNVVIRPERASDVEAIAEITREAFVGHPHTNHKEQLIINALREAKALAVSLVAELEAKVVGQATFARVTISDGARDWYGLGPLSVKPGFQRMGIGQALVRKGLEALRELGGRGCVVVGEANFYERFGFRNRPGLVFAGLPQEYFLAVPFGEELPAGEVTCHPVFYAFP